MTERPHIVDWGRAPYAVVFASMQAFTRSRTPDTADQFWIVEHPPVFTLGQASRPEHLLAPGDIPVVATDRGGQVTYHGPGQIVVYPLLDLRRRGIGPRRIVYAIEQALIDVLGQLGIDAQRQPGAPGVFVGSQKIASIGLRVRKNGCYHGLALNLDMDLEPFSRINPCGYAGLQMTHVRRCIGHAPSLREAGVALSRTLLERLQPGALQLPEKTALESTDPETVV